MNETTEMTLAELYKGVDFGQTPDPIKHNEYMNGVAACIMNSIPKKSYEKLAELMEGKLIHEEE